MVKMHLPFGPWKEFWTLHFRNLAQVFGASNPYLENIERSSESESSTSNRRILAPEAEFGGDI